MCKGWNLVEGICQILLITSSPPSLFASKKFLLHVGDCIRAQSYGFYIIKTCWSWLLKRDFSEKYLVIWREKEKCCLEFFHAEVPFQFISTNRDFWNGIFMTKFLSIKGLYQLNLRHLLVLISLAANEEMLTPPTSSCYLGYFLEDLLISSLLACYYLQISFLYYTQPKNKFPALFGKVSLSVLFIQYLTTLVLSSPSHSQF